MLKKSSSEGQGLPETYIRSEKGQNDLLMMRGGITFLSRCWRKFYSNHIRKSSQTGWSK